MDSWIVYQHERETQKKQGTISNMVKGKKSLQHLARDTFRQCRIYVFGMGRGVQCPKKIDEMCGLKHTTQYIARRQHLLAQPDRHTLKRITRMYVYKKLPRRRSTTRPTSARISKFYYGVVIGQLMLIPNQPHRGPAWYLPISMQACHRYIHAY